MDILRLTIDSFGSTIDCFGLTIDSFADDIRREYPHWTKTQYWLGQRRRWGIQTKPRWSRAIAFTTANESQHWHLR